MIIYLPHYEGGLVLDKLEAEQQTQVCQILKEDPFNLFVIAIEVIRIKHWLHISRKKKSMTQICYSMEGEGRNGCRRQISGGMWDGIGDRVGGGICGS